MNLFFKQLHAGLDLQLMIYVIAKVMYYDIGAEILFLKYFGHEPIKYQTPENGKHMYQYQRIESYLNLVSKRDIKLFFLF